MSQITRISREGPCTGLLAASIGALIASGGLAGSAWAQQEEDDDAVEADDTIIVTGTRIRRDDFSSAQATTVVTADDMSNLGVVSVADMVNQLPNNIASVSPEGTADSPFYLGASIANMRGLNTAYGVRTLTMLDSRRITPTNNGGGVDMNFVPSALIERIETVTGGNSATYGADAMAGVVNVILDDDVENVRLDLNYMTTDEGDGDQYTLSFGTGARFLDGRAQFTVGLDSSRQDAIEDCTTREFCQRGLGLFRNGEGSTLEEYTAPRDGVVFEGQPEWIPVDGHRYSVTPTGVTDAPDYPDANNYALGWYQFNEAGTDLVPYLTPQTTTQLELDAINSVGTQTGFSFFGGGNLNWATPFGGGRSIYADVPIRPETARDNLFARFSVELEGGIEISSDLTYGETVSESLQNASRNNLQSFCVLERNAYLQPELGASQRMRDIFTARAVDGVFPGGDVNLNCLEAPFLGGSYNELPPEVQALGGERNDFPAAMEFSKDFSAQVDRRNRNDSNAASLSVSANGPLFEGGSWTWDTYAQYGETENRQTLSGWRAARRWDMALDSVVDVDGEVRCAVLAETPESLVEQDRWRAYLLNATFDVPEMTDADREDIFNQLRDGCTPFNPFGSAPLPQDAFDYVFPTLFEGTDNDQTAVSVNFSGDAWRGIGNAGAMRMAAGVDWRQNDTQNLADPNRVLGADFNFVGNSSSGQFDRIYGDNWWGRTKTKEAWVEFDLPLVSDKPGADTFSINTSYRFTEQRTERISGLENVTAPKFEREVDSWKATMLWQPANVMRVRVTRSRDTRAPSARELYATNSYATETGGQTEVVNPWRFNVTEPGFDLNIDSGDRVITIQGGNAALDDETSVTETLGLVFQPSETVPGLQVSVDYYETTILGGIRQLGRNETITACQEEIGDWRDGPIPVVPESDWRFCNQIEFAEGGDPDQQVFIEGATTPGAFGAGGDPIVDGDGNLVPTGTPNPFAPYTEIVTVAQTTINEEDFISRGIDYSVNYVTQLGGGGSINARALFTRYLEQRVNLLNSFGPTDVSGQTGGNNITSSFGSFSVNYSPTPRIRGNLFMTYQKNAFSLTAQARYTGTGRLNIQDGWIGVGDSLFYTRHFQGSPFPPGDPTQRFVEYDPDLAQTTALPELPSFTTLNLNFGYDFGSSRFNLDQFESLRVYLNIENVGDRIPRFFSGNGAGGINTALFSGMGRSYRMGVSMEF